MCVVCDTHQLRLGSRCGAKRLHAVMSCVVLRHVGASLFLGGWGAEVKLLQAEVLICCVGWGGVGWDGQCCAAGDHTGQHLVFGRIAALPAEGGGALGGCHPL